MEDQHTHNLFYYLLHWLISALAVLVTCKLMPGWKVKGFGGALITALVIGIANALVWPILIFLTLPVNILTFGLFTFVINGAIIKICSAVLSDFEVDGWISAIVGSLLLSIISTLFHYLFI